MTTNAQAERGQLNEPEDWDQVCARLEQRDVLDPPDDWRQPTERKLLIELLIEMIDE